MGIFLLGRFFQRFSDKAALAVVILSIAVNVFIAFATSIFWLWYVAIGFAISFATAIVINVLMGKKGAGRE